MMQSPENRLGDDRALARSFDPARLWRVAVERLMWARAMVILEVRTEDAEQMSLAQHDHMIEALASDRADHSLGVSILPGEAFSVFERRMNPFGR